MPTPDQGFNQVDIHDGFEDQEVEILEGLVYPNKVVDIRPQFSRRDMVFNNMPGTDRYNAEKFGNTDFELIAESSMKPFANNSH